MAKKQTNTPEEIFNPFGEHATFNKDAKGNIISATLTIETYKEVVEALGEFMMMQDMFKMLGKCMENCDEDCAGECAEAEEAAEKPKKTATKKTTAKKK